MTHLNKVTFTEKKLYLVFITTATVAAWISTPMAILSYYGKLWINPPASLLIVIAYLILFPMITYAFIDTFRETYGEAKKMELNNAT